VGLPPVDAARLTTGVPLPATREPSTSPTRVGQMAGRTECDDRSRDPAASRAPPSLPVAAP